MQTFEPKPQPAAAPTVETPTPAAEPDLHPVLRLQRLVGNRAVQRMFVQRAVDPTKDDDVLAFMKKLNGEGADAILRDLESEGRAVQLAVRRNLVRARGDIHVLDKAFRSPISWSIKVRLVLTKIDPSKNVIAPGRAR